MHTGGTKAHVEKLIYLIRLLASGAEPWRISNRLEPFKLFFAFVQLQQKQQLLFDELGFRSGLKMEENAIPLNPFEQNGKNEMSIGSTAQFGNIIAVEICAFDRNGKNVVWKNRGYWLFLLDFHSLRITDIERTRIYRSLLCIS